MFYLFFTYEVVLLETLQAYPTLLQSKPAATAFFPARPPQESEPMAYSKEPLSVPYFSFDASQTSLDDVDFLRIGSRQFTKDALSAKSHIDTSTKGS